MTDSITKSAPSWRRMRTVGYSDDCLWYTRFINQYVALPFSYLFCRLGLSPNAVSVLSFITTLAGLGVLLFPGTTIENIVVAYLLLALGYVLDSSDGQIARAAGKSSKSGQWLDHLLDGFKLVLLNLTMGWLLVYAFSGSIRMLALCWLALGLNMCAQLGFFLAWNFKVFIYGKHLVAKTMSNEKRVSFLFIFLQPTDFGIFLLLLFLLPSAELFLKGYLAYGAYSMGITMAYVAVSVYGMIRQKADGETS